MIIPALSIEQDGPGIELSAETAGIALRTSDPVTDFEYARNAVTLTYGLSGAGITLVPTKDRGNEKG